MPSSSLTGINAPDKPPTEETPSRRLFHRVVEQGERGGRTVRAADLKPHFLQNAGHAVADGGRGRKGKIDNAKRRIDLRLASCATS